MASKLPGLISRGVAEHRLKAEEAAQVAASLGPDIRSEACADCGRFGPWANGELHYCEDHVPQWLRYLSKTRAEEARREL